MVVERTKKHMIYQSIKEVKEHHPDYSLEDLCQIGKVSRSGYNKWIKRKPTENDLKNQKILSLIQQIHTEHQDMGYRRIRDWLQEYHGIDVNDKRILRLCRVLRVQSIVKNRNNCCTKPSVDPYCIAENILNRDFAAEKPNEKWLTDVTEFKYYVGPEKKKCKIYLSAILDLYDHRIVSFTIGDNNNNHLVFQNFEDAVAMHPDAHPLFHSDRGFQYTNQVFHKKIEDAGMTQSMSRVAKCIDNGPMEGFWGILKRESYYGHTFTRREDLMKMIEDYIEFYNNKRLQRKLGIMTPIKKYESYALAG